MITLKNWSIVSKVNPYQAPELGIISLHGFVYGHPNYPNGKEITTSQIENIHNGLVYTMSGNVYTLFSEDVNPAYEKLFPNAFERLFEMER